MRNRPTVQSQVVRLCRWLESGMRRNQTDASLSDYFEQCPFWAIVN